MTGLSAGKGFSRGKGLNTKPGLSTGGGLSPPFQDDVAPGAPVNVVPPTITGLAQVGQTVACTTGTWSGNFPFTYAYQWQADGNDIDGATTNTHLLNPAETGKMIDCRVTATNSFGSSSHNSNALGPVAFIPTNTAIPIITGQTIIGSILSCSTGFWLAYPDPTYAYQWRAAGVDIAGATSNNYTITVNENGKLVSCSVVATNSEGSSPRVFSTAVGPITGLVPENITNPAISGLSSVGSTLTYTAGTWDGEPVPSITHEWFANGIATGITANTYVVPLSNTGVLVSVKETATNSLGNASVFSNNIGPITSIPVNSSAPVASGSAIVGSTVSTTNGIWTAYPNPTYTYQWKRNGAAIPGSTQSTYVLVVADIGTNIKCTVVATNSSGATPIDTNIIGPVAGSAPVNTALPSIFGIAAVGSILTYNTGNWNGVPTPTISNEWISDGIPTGIKTATYTIPPSDSGKIINVKETATNIVGSGNVNSNSLGPVTSGDTIPPTMTNVSIAGDIISADASEPGRCWIIWELSPAERSGQYVKDTVLAGTADASYYWSPVDPGSVSVDVDISELQGTYYVKMAMEDYSQNVQLIAAQQQIVVGPKAALIDYYRKISGFTIDQVIAIPDAGQYVIGVAWARNGQQDITAVVGSAGVTVTLVTNGTLGDTGTFTTGTIRSYIRWFSVSATQAGTATITFTNVNGTIQCYFIYKMAGIDIASRRGAFLGVGNLLTGGLTNAVPLPALPVDSVALFIAFKNSDVDASVTLGGEFAQADLQGELLRAGSASNLNAASGFLFPATGDIDCAVAYTPEGYSLVSMISFQTV